MSPKPYPSSDTPYSWGGEHFCGPDATALYTSEPDRRALLGEPDKLRRNPVPPTFCAVCLDWFDHPETLTPDYRPAQQGDTNA